MSQHSISVIIPTFNSAATVSDCLKSIFNQDYPREKLEVIIADAGSQDVTLDRVNKFKDLNTIKFSICKNLLKTGEAGKAIGFKQVKNEIIAFIDSDNILPDKSWLTKMVEPFQDTEIIASEPLEYTYRVSDGVITRYCALMGMNDPLCLFIGNYDRYSFLANKWTEMPHKEEDKGGFLKIDLHKDYLPTIGANGFLIRRSALDCYSIGDYLFDIDIISELLDKSGADKIIRFAKVKTGIIHIFSGNLSTFAKKQRRRVRDYLYYQKLRIRKYPWQKVNKLKVIKFILYCLLVLPLVVQSLRGYFRKPDKAWFFHPLACWITLWEYGWGKLSSFFKVKEMDRKGWQQ